MSSENKVSKQDIITYVIAGVALILALVVVLAKVGVFEKEEETTTAEVESTVVVVSETMENGDVVYYTMLEHYVRPHVSSNYVYPEKVKPSTTKGTTTTTNQFVEESRAVQVTNENGIPLLNEWGEPVTEIEAYTVDVNKKTTKVQTTASATKSDENQTSQSAASKSEAPVEEVTTSAPKESSVAEQG